MPVAIVSQIEQFFKAMGVAVVVTDGVQPPFCEGQERQGASRGVARRGRDGSCRPAPFAVDGLVNRCISGRYCGGVAVFKSGGVQCRRWTSGPESTKKRVGGTRGVIRGFSRASRRRMVDKLMGVDWQGIASADKHAQRGRAMFITLTYPAAWPEDRRVWKSHLQAFRKRVERWSPFEGAVWKQEPQQRGAPHYHILVVFRDEQLLPLIRDWVSRSWFEVVGSEDPAHLAAGTNVQVVYGKPGRLMCYLAKYLGKEWDRDSEGDETGRVWGVWGELPRGPIVSVTFRSRQDWIEFIRRVRRWGRGSCYLSKLTASWGSFRVYGDGVSLSCLSRGLGMPVVLRGVV